MPDACSTEPCDVLDWDSAFWGFPVGQVRGSTLVHEDLTGIDAWCRERSIVCLYFLASFDSPTTVRAAEEGGFHLVDVRVTLSRPSASPASPDQPEDTVGVIVRSSELSDAAPLQRIAAVSHRDTRFFFDLHFPSRKSERLYERWITESCAGYANRVLVAEYRGTPVGYVTCHLPSGTNRAGQIGLVGVAPEFRGRGVGRGLVLDALDWFAQQQVDTVTVVTQGRNIAAQALYQRRGFITQSQQLWYHKWFRRPEPEHSVEG